ncbi:MAG TPA: hypothetical protein VFE59_12255 [Trebonia sp.]|nr:hypothetical protein [Trebonia sp.]
MSCLSAWWHIPRGDGGARARAVALLRSEHPGLDVSLSEAPTPTLLRQLRGARLRIVQDYG